MDAKFIFALILLSGICVSIASISPFHPQTLSSKMAEDTTCNMTQWMCAGKSDDCSGDYSNMTGCNITGSTCCALGLYCISGTCQTDNIGANCSNIAQCHGSLTAGTLALCMNGTCQYLSSLGDQCTSTNNCLPGLNCTNSVCTGVGLNVACNPGVTSCGYGLYCGLNPNGTAPPLVCLTDIAVGGSCSLGVPCAPGSVCLSGKCVAQYSQGQGTACASTTCSSGLVCSPINGTCVTATTSYTSCTNNTDCSAGQVCLCSVYTLESYCTGLESPNPCTDAASDLNSCLVSSSCTSDGDAPNSCCYNNCYSDFKKSQSCACSLAKTGLGDCYYNPYCGGFPVWAIIVIIVVAIVLVLAIVLLVFFMMRRRHQYDSI